MCFLFGTIPSTLEWNSSAVCTNPAIESMVVAAVSCGTTGDEVSVDEISVAGGTLAVGGASAEQTRSVILMSTVKVQSLPIAEV